MAGIFAPARQPFRFPKHLSLWYYLPLTSLVAQMLNIRTFFIIATLAAAAFAQQPETVATSTLRNFTTADLSGQARTAWEQREKSYMSAREQLLNQMVTESVLQLEAKTAGTTAAKLVEKQRSKVADPTEEQIKATYDANLEAFGNKPLQQVRTTIVRFLRREPEDQLLKSYVDELAGKYKVSYQTDVNAAGLKPTDPLFTIGSRVVTDQEFEAKYRFALYEAKAGLIDDVNAELESTILNALADAEAAALKIDQQAYIAQEITNKLKSSTDDERDDLQSALKKRLFLKYKVKLLLTPPPPIAQNISVDDDPARGPVNAPVTIVMFADFQCPTCGRMHPVLDKVIAEFPGKIRFVARDFPLESIHENAFKAAVAANAANAQGKYWEYSELLYNNQETLDAASLKKFAEQVGLNVHQFEIDSNSEKYSAEVRNDIADGESYGVSGTPTIFVNGVKVRRLSADDFRNAIQYALKTTTPGASRPARQ
jgi:protein-disulfide isomerase